MIETSFVAVMDGAVRQLLFAKFGDLLDLSDADRADAPNRAVIQYPKGVALRMIAEKRQVVALNFISFYRTAMAMDWERNRSPVAREGMSVRVDDGKGGEAEDYHIKAMPVKLEYDVWFWTRDLDKNQKLIEHYIWWQHDNPYMEFSLGGGLDLGTQLHFGSVVDESTVEVMLDKGLYFVSRAELKVDGWLMKVEPLGSSSSYKNGIIESIVLYIKDKDDLKEYDYQSLVDRNSYNVEYNEELADKLHLGKRVIE